MKIGLSYSRCVRDIVEGKVAFDDVLVIIARTDFDPRDDTQWKSIWQGYNAGNLLSHAEWYGYEDKDENQFRSVSINLWETGKLHQPRKFGARVPRLPYFWLEVFLAESELESRPAVREAYEQFLMLAGLTGTKFHEGRG